MATNSKLPGYMVSVPYGFINRARNANNDILFWSDSLASAGSTFLINLFTVLTELCGSDKITETYQLTKLQYRLKRRWWEIVTHILIVRERYRLHITRYNLQPLTKILMQRAVWTHIGHSYFPRPTFAYIHWFLTTQLPTQLVAHSDVFFAVRLSLLLLLKEQCVVDYVHKFLLRQRLI